TWISEDAMLAAAAARVDPSRWEGPVLGFQRCKRRRAPIAGIEIENDTAATPAGRPAAVRGGPLVPPLLDLRRVAGCVAHAVRGPRVLARILAQRTPPACASAGTVGFVERDD